MTPEEREKYDGMRGASHVYHTSGVLLQSISNILGPLLLKKGAPDIRSSLISVILLYAISAEVGIKALLTKEGKVIPRSHDLKTMFDDLEEDTKNNIIRKVEADNFDMELENIKSSFVEWRYFYEGGNLSVNIDFLKKFSETINELILS